MMKEILNHMGMRREQTGSPKIILKTAYKAGAIKDENVVVLYKKEIMWVHSYK